MLNESLEHSLSSCFETETERDRESDIQFELNEGMKQEKTRNRNGVWMKKSSPASRDGRGATERTSCNGTIKQKESPGTERVRPKTPVKKPL